MSTELQKFSALGLKPELLDAISDTGYTTPTPIQVKAIPLILSKKDLLAEAQTGTGKTASFILPVLQRTSELNKGRAKPGQPRCLVLTPTRELAAQVAESVKLYGMHLSLKSLAVFGGVNINPQRMAMRKPVDILIATPGRLLDLARKNIVRLTEIDILVIDEADRMLQLGFSNEIEKILRLLPKQRQSLLFSATFSTDIRKLAHTLLKKPIEISALPDNKTTELIEQVAHLVDKSRKRSLLTKLIKEHNWSQVLVFTRTKHGANKLVEKLHKDGIDALAIHGDKSQAARTRALMKFKDGSLKVLIATDIAARGIDIENLPNVVNYELPHVSELYLHRIGRTGRAGKNGMAISLVNIDEVIFLENIEKLIGKPIPRVDIEGYTGHTEKPGSTIVEPKPPSKRRRSKRGKTQ
ncbi:MAG: DEAD/DEAH box helicase [Granulosicoccus sp.]